jgi:hypothetical protein
LVGFYAVVNASSDFRRYMLIWTKLKRRKHEIMTQWSVCRFPRFCDFVISYGATWKQNAKARNIDKVIVGILRQSVHIVIFACFSLALCGPKIGPGTNQPP